MRALKEVPAVGGAGAGNEGQEFRNLPDFGILGAESVPLWVSLSDATLPGGYRWQCFVLGGGGYFDKGGMVGV